MIASVAAAISIAAGSVWILTVSAARTYKSPTLPAAEFQKNNQQDPAPPKDQTDPIKPVQSEQKQTDNEQAGQKTVLISKCIENGKTNYSAGQCAKTAVNKTLEIQETSGIVSPSKASVAQYQIDRAEAAQRRIDSEKQMADAARTAPATAPAETRQEEVVVQQQIAVTNDRDRLNACKQLDQQIVNVDKAANQRLSSAEQSSLSKNRRATRNTQLQTGC